MDKDEICFTCGRYYNAITEPDHEQECEEKMAEAVTIKPKTIPELYDILERLLKVNE